MVKQLSGAGWLKDINDNFAAVASRGFIGDEGKRFIVDPAGNGDYTEPQSAIDACEDWRGDKIICKAGTISVDTPVLFNKQGITVVSEGMGLPPEVQGERFTIQPSATFTDGPAAIITAPCRIIGLGFTTRYIAADDPDSAGLVIDCEEAGGWSGGFSSIENCRFSCWYGAQAYGILTIGGDLNFIRGNSFSGLFGGFGTAAIGMQNDTGGFAPAHSHVEYNYFYGIGSAKPALKFITGAIPLSLVFAHNRNLDGFGTRGPMLDNNSVVSGGLVADNWTGLANKAAAFLNLTNSNLSFNDNHYEE